QDRHAEGHLRQSHSGHAADALIGRTFSRIAAGWRRAKLCVVTVMAVLRIAELRFAPAGALIQADVRRR
ncbi:MAG: hypothetical protein ACREV7_23210, partial [Steroidobacteraceae bacterium]